MPQKVGVRVSDDVKHAVSIPFNWGGLSKSNYKNCMRRREWWEHREQLLRTYTLPSLKAQTFQDFDIWAMFLKRDKKLSKGCRGAIRDFGGDCVFPDPEYGGCILDGFYEVTAEYEGVDGLVVVGLDSDDMYAPQALARVAERPFEDGACLIFPNGYIYDVRDGRMAHHAIDGYPEHDRRSRTLPFWAVMMGTRALANQETFEEFRADRGLRRANNTLLRSDRHYLLPDNLTCYLLHEENVCAGWDNRNMVSKITRYIDDPDQKLEIIQRFGGPWNDD